MIRVLNNITKRTVKRSLFFTHHSSLFTFLFALSICIASCTSDDIVTPEKGQDVSLEEIRLSVSPMVAAEMSRAINYSSQNDAFDPTTKLGLFIIHEDKYNKLKNMNDVTYGYNNLPVTIQADGTIKADNDTTFYYPAERNKKVAAAVYAPYDPNMTWDKMEEGYTFSVADNQSKTEDVLRSDLLIGRPKEIDSHGVRVFRKHDATVNIPVKHALTKVTLNLDIDINESTRCDSIAIVMQNTPKKIIFHLENTPNEAIDLIVPGDVVMQGIKKPFDGEADGTVKHLSATAIVVPSYMTTNNTTFQIKFIGRENGFSDLTLTAKPSLPRPFITGKAQRYSLAIHASDTDYTETLPDEDDDDWTMGAKEGETK